ncbi:MAG: hypothetical protein NC037_02060 [Bacteroides sp.]|nr:hypothetical protein [Bacillota bacterium]MCM1393466.1 hypothetical protein [[Eubacterium] siraeum]MCM1455300.1 hypothetical protein [Bacteroides sp.]
MYYNFKEIKYTIRKDGGGLVQGTFTGNIGFKRPQSKEEADVMARAWLQKKYPNCEILDLEIALL